MLTHDCYFSILTHLNLDIPKLATVSKYFNELTNNQELWKRLFVSKTNYQILHNLNYKYLNYALNNDDVVTAIINEGHTLNCTKEVIKY